MLALTISLWHGAGRFVKGVTMYILFLVPPAVLTTFAWLVWYVASCPKSRWDEMCLADREFLRIMLLGASLGSVFVLVGEFGRVDILALVLAPVYAVHGRFSGNADRA